MDINPVGWFEIPVVDMARAKDFYESVFVVDLEEHQMGTLLTAQFPMKPGCIGAAGSLVKGEGYQPSLAGVLIYFSSPNIEEMLSRVTEQGGKVITEKTSIGQYGFIALIEDCEGNRIGLHSRD